MIVKFHSSKGLLALCRAKKFFIKLHTIKSGWSIVYIEGLRVIVSQNIVFLSLNIDLVLANSADADEMPHPAAFHLGLHCLPKHPFRGFWSTKGRAR